MTPTRRPPLTVVDIPDLDKPYGEMTTQELRDTCAGKGIEHARTANKPKLLKLIEEFENPPREIDALLRDVAGDMGEGVISLGSLMPLFTYVPTGSFLLDLAGAGGYAEGCGHMVYGVEGCSKTTLWLIECASVQAKYPEDMCVWVDVEKKFDPMWAEKLGVDLERLFVVRPRNGEHAVDIMEGAARSVEVAAIFLDSIPSLAPMRVLAKSAEDPTVAERARLVGLLCSKMQQAWIDEGLRGHKFTFFCINQFRERVGVTHGDPRTLPGGRFQNYLVDTKLELKKVEKFSEGTEFRRHTHNEHVFKFTKTKGAFSIKQGETVMVMDDVDRTDGLSTGRFDDYLTVATYAKKRGLVTGSGASWFIDGVTTDSGLHRKFGKQNDIVCFLKKYPEEFMRLKQLLIIIQRRESRLPDIPPDGFLLEWLEDGQEERYSDTLDSLGHTRYAEEDPTT